LGFISPLLDAVLTLQVLFASFGIKIASVGAGGVGTLPHIRLMDEVMFKEAVREFGE
jgi:hypothetical protein